jgi:hypothetical protein
MFELSSLTSSKCPYCQQKINFGEVHDCSCIGATWSYRTEPIDETTQQLNRIEKLLKDILYQLENK